MADSPSELQTEIEKLEARHAEHPEGRFFVPLANAYRKAGEVERAEAVLREGLRRHPDYLSAHIVLGRCLADRGAVDEATDEFQHVLSIDPQNLIALRTLGDLAMSSGRASDSARWYEQLLAVDPMNEEARRALEAVSEAESAAPAAPEEEGTVELPSLPETEEGLYGGFVDLSEEPAESEPPVLEGGGEVVTETIAELYARQGLQDRAVEVYRELIRRRGGDPALERRLAELTAPPAPAEEPATPLAEEPVLPEPETPAPEIEPEPFDEPLPVLGAVGALPEPVDQDELVVDSDPFASSFEYGFLDREPEGARPEPEAAQPEPEPEAAQPEPEPEPEPLVEWAEPPAAEPVAEIEPLAERSATSIAAYLSDLAAWRPGAAGQPATEPQAAAPAGQPAREPEPQAAAAERPAPEPEAAAPSELPAPEPQAAAPAPILEPEAAQPGFEAEAEPEPEADPFALAGIDALDEPEPAAEPQPEPSFAELEPERVAEPEPSFAEFEPEAVAESEPEPEAKPIADLEADVFEPWVSRESVADSSAPVTEPAAASAPADDDMLFPWETLEETAPAAQPEPSPAQEPAAPPTAPAAAQEEDDDLESFQAWLRSLKR